MVTISAPGEAAQHVGRHLGSSDYITIEQDRIDEFAKATGDFQWIHVDAERAKDGPFGKTIAHGYLTLALFPTLMHEVLEWKNTRMGVNYGLNKVRFPSPVPVGSRVRLSARLVDCEPQGDDGLQVTIEATFEIEGQSKPACVAEVVLRYFFEQA
jgi:acyl dehydratase